jgi:5-methylthioadenosine/S-adenosylhomocysteine deaminase
MTDEVTCIRSADWIVSFDPGHGKHVYRRGADVVFAGSRIVHIGPRFDGAVTREISGRRKLVLPGLVSVHGHLGTRPLGKGFYEDLARPNHYVPRIQDQLGTVHPPDAATRRAATQVAVAELLMSGCTTVADMSLPYQGWAATLVATGVRAYLAPMFKSASVTARHNYVIEYHWDEAHGERTFREALETLEEARAHPSGRLGGIVMPAQADTCTPQLLVAASEAARSLGFPLQIQSGQSLPEFHEMIGRHGRTGIAFLEGLGVLGPETCLAHCVFVDRHPWVHWGVDRDLEILARTRASVAHCPTSFASRGALMHDFGSYRDAGINLSIGTDFHPHNMAEEMRLALLGARVARGFAAATGTEDVFHAATLGGAAALLRDDIGQLSVGAKADLVLVDLDHSAMQPCHDPLRSFVYGGGDRAVTDVYVDGCALIEDRRYTTIAVGEAIAALELGHAEAIRDVANRDWARRDAFEISPLTLPVRE